MYILAISNISDAFNDKMYIDTVDQFYKVCTNEAYNYYLYNSKNELISKIENL